MEKLLKIKAISAKTISFSALFAALSCIGTLIITIPLPNGYFNVGDVFVLLAGWCLGPVYGAIAAAIGTALADVISGYTLYALPTFFIKGIEAVMAYAIWRLISKILKNTKWDFIARVVSALLGGVAMAVGYFLFESVLYGFGGAAVSIIGNLTQGVCCAVCAILLISALSPVKGVHKLFPYLTANE